MKYEARGWLQGLIVSNGAQRPNQGTVFWGVREVTELLRLGLHWLSVNIGYRYKLLLQSCRTRRKYTNLGQWTSYGYSSLCLMQFRSFVYLCASPTCEKYAWVIPLSHAVSRSDAVWMPPLLWWSNPQTVGWTLFLGGLKTSYAGGISSCWRS